MAFDVELYNSPTGTFDIYFEVIDPRRHAYISWAEMYADDAPRYAIVSWSELEIPTAPRSVQISWAELEYADLRRAQLSWMEFEYGDDRGTRVAWSELFTPLVQLPVQLIDTDGTNIVFRDAALLGHEYINNGNTWLHIKNGAMDVNITIVTTGYVDNEPFVGVPLAIADRVITVPANSEMVIGIFPPSLYNDVDSKVLVLYDDISNVTVAALTYTET